MPHQCTACDTRLADGSQQVLEGCPDCGGNKFQYVATPANNASKTPDAASDLISEAEESTTDDSPARDDATLVPSADESGADDTEGSIGEDRSQHTARTEVVDIGSIPTSHQNTSGTSDPNPTEEPEPDLDELREELNSQFEGIRIVHPGQYEINLTQLYEQEEVCIISLREDGRYIIEQPSR